MLEKKKLFTVWAVLRLWMSGKITWDMRKIILLAITAILLSGCAMTHPRMTRVLFLDYRPYESAGFFISPNAYNGEHAVLGELCIEIIPAVVPAKVTDDLADGIYKNAKPKIELEEISSEEILEEAVSKALEMGADGLSNFSVQVRPSNVTYGKRTVLNSEIYEVRGLCILRK